MRGRIEVADLPKGFEAPVVVRRSNGEWVYALLQHRGTDNFRLVFSYAEGKGIKGRKQIIERTPYSLLRHCAPTPTTAGPAMSAML